MPTPAQSTKEQILLAAERLIADHGVDGVSMRQIGAAVGSGNNSAVLYHFGSKEKLVQAIFEHRLPRLRERRAQLVAERQPTDLRGWLECRDLRGAGAGASSTTARTSGSLPLSRCTAAKRSGTCRSDS